MDLETTAEQDISMSPIVKFDKAPLSEVVCGVEFNAPDFSSIHFGLYWQTIRDRFPTPPLDKPPIGGIEIMASVPRLRRVWFESSDRKRFVQLQTDRFHYNWKGRSKEDEYPHFDVLYPCFKQEWDTFQQWWLELDKVPLQLKR
jgi:uncharacterized protein (TIGR04255 family)